MVFNLENVSLAIDDKTILDSISVNFEENKFNTIIGPNGCGKSSIIKLLAKIYKPNVGKIIFMNEEIDKIKRSDFAKQVAFFFQFNVVRQDITVEQMVYFGRSVYKNMFNKMDEYDRKIVNDSLKKCNIFEFKDRNIKTMSGGEMQRVYLAMILSQEPDIIILDEPTNHLDIKYQFQLLTLIKDVLKEKKLTVICVLHDINLVFKYSDNTVILKEGKVVTSGKTNEVITESIIKDVFEVDSIIYNTKSGKHIDFII